MKGLQPSNKHGEGQTNFQTSGEDDNSQQQSKKFCDDAQITHSSIVADAARVDVSIAAARKFRGNRYLGGLGLGREHQDSHHDE